MRVPPVVGELGLRDRPVGLVVLDLDDARRILVREGLDQHSVDDAEDRGVGTHADGDRQDRERDESWRAAQRPGGEPEVLTNRIKHKRSLISQRLNRRDMRRAPRRQIAREHGNRS